MDNYQVLNLYYLKEDNSEIRIKELARACPKHLFKIGYAPLEWRFVDTIKDIFGTDILKDLLKMPRCGINNRVGFKRIKKELEKMFQYLEDLNDKGLRYVKIKNLVNINLNDYSFGEVEEMLSKLYTVIKESWYETKYVNNMKVATVFNSKIKAITNGWIVLETQNPYLYEMNCLEIMIETCEYVLNSKDPKSYFVKLENM